MFSSRPRQHPSKIPGACDRQRPDERARSQLVAPHSSASCPIRHQRRAVAEHARREHTRPTSVRRATPTEHRAPSAEAAHGRPLGSASTRKRRCTVHREAARVGRVLGNSEVAARASYTWAALSSASHHHGYELRPTIEALRDWLEAVEKFLQRIECAADGGVSTRVGLLYVEKQTGLTEKHSRKLASLFNGSGASSSPRFSGQAA